MAYDPFTIEYTVPAHGSTTITTVYTNEIKSVDDWVDNVVASLAASEVKIVGAAVEQTPRVYSRSHGYVRKAAVIQLCVGQQCLVYHICCAAVGVPDKLDSFFRNLNYKFAGFSIPTDKNLLYFSDPPLFMMNHIDINDIWRNPDHSSRRKKTIRDVAGVIVDISYKDDDGGLTDNDHRLWGVAPLSQKHVEYATKKAYLSYEVFRCLDVYERGFFRRLYLKTEYKQPLFGW